MAEAKAKKGFFEEESLQSFKTEERRVIFASSLGTVFEWYDFYLYATLAPFFAALFFPPGNETAALLSAFATYAAGFLVRPFGAIVFGRIGDLVGRKYTFLVTIVFMGGATFLVGLLPTFQTIGWAAPILLVTLRLVQGLALGGEYGGAATYVAEHAPNDRRGYDTAWIQTTATLGFFLALAVIGACRVWMDAKVFSDWGWRIPFWLSLILLVFSILSLLIGTPFFIFFGWLSDRIGRLKIILAGCLIAAVTYFPLFQGLTHYVNPALEEFSQKNPITVAATPVECQFHIFVGPWSKFSDCDRVKDFLTKQGLSFKSVPADGKTVTTIIGTTKIEGWDQKKLTEALKQTGAPASADKGKVNWVMAELILVIMVIYVTMVYGPIAAFLVELFPTEIRYTSMSLPYHIGNGWFGGMLPLTATAMVAATGDIYYGLWYPIVVSVMTVIVGAIFLSETRTRDIRTYQHQAT